jgi:hypothetical protein
MNLIRECGSRQKPKQRKTMKQIPVSDLNTDNYTQIFHEDEPKCNAPHHFEIKRKADGETIAKVDMQEGPILESGVNGCCNEDLINIVVDKRTSLLKLWEYMNFDFVDKEERWLQIGSAIKRHSLTSDEADANARLI